ncbi:two-component system sensor histidine kinase RegB [Hasllibacter halocynthiae]|uniref:histidine kinase n=1 Tax=Hasllibacter halocynthiae TaxID=595589 RepID=A0A2T0X2K3_9RHOB|nr:ActS/PrrB/RegB family redox-sensitive histidine kinase [Hasllibacter halocynthiae]PRY93170.1 two-component system sensor histidine kinase RegB [Hasllibacter halocynthiae]
MPTARDTAGAARDGPDLALDLRTPAWIRLRTLVLLRWLAIGGQLAAVIVAQEVLDLGIAAELAYLAIGLSVAANVFATLFYPEGKRLTQDEILAILLFDVVQLGFLLSLTGGLGNPFALLILAPVTIAATVLRLRWTLLVGAVAAVSITLQRWAYVPLRKPDGTVVGAEPLFTFGLWLAILTGIAFLGLYARRVTGEMRSMSEALLATQAALAREQKLTDLGGVVAATAHELGTPLATIKLASTELAQELEGAHREDAELIAAQADRCTEILRSMGRAGKDDRHLRRAPLSAVLREAAAPHEGRGKAIRFEARGDDPLVERRPELLHGLRNIVENAVDHARARVVIVQEVGPAGVAVTVRDDGPGFPPHAIGNIGEPFPKRRPGAKGLGLGLFIAVTLLRRTGAELKAANRGARGGPGGAEVTLRWPPGALDAAQGPGAALGENPVHPVA